MAEKTYVGAGAADADYIFETVAVSNMDNKDVILIHVENAGADLRVVLNGALSASDELILDDIVADAQTGVATAFQAEKDAAQAQSRGTNFGKDGQTAQSNGTSCTTSSTFQTKLVLTTGAVTGIYLIGWSVQASNSIQDADCGVRLQNITDAKTVSGPVNYVGAGEDPDESSLFSALARVSFNGLPKTFEIQWNRPFGVDGAAEVSLARITFWRVA